MLWTVVQEPVEPVEPAAAEARPVRLAQPELWDRPGRPRGRNRLLHRDR